jgi:hypothetical protein
VIAFDGWRKLFWPDAFEIHPAGIKPIVSRQQVLRDELNTSRSGRKVAKFKVLSTRRIRPGTA